MVFVGGLGSTGFSTAAKNSRTSTTLGQAGVELMLELNRSDEGPAGAIEVDATEPLHPVVDELLRIAIAEP